MSKLLNLINEVQDQKLSKEQLEEYHSTLTGLYAQLMWEMAEKEKAEAIYFLEMKKMDDKVTDVSIKRFWRGTPDGQRLIELKNYAKGTEKILASIKNRIYSLL